MKNSVIIKNVTPSSLNEKQVRASFKQLLDNGYKLVVVGQAKSKAPGYLLRTRPPKHLIEVFGARYYLSDIRRNANGNRFFVCYMVMPQNNQANKGQRKRIYPRIFYKDSSLIWRSASHVISTKNDFWVGKGAVKPVTTDGFTYMESQEDTTNLPYEIDSALDAISRRTKEVVVDNQGLVLVLRNAPDNRIVPYSDFTAPRKRAMADKNLTINKNKKIAWFKNETRPTSLAFEKGFEPDLKNGLIDSSHSYSKLYGGPIQKFRIASKNRHIQYMFIQGQKHAWIIPPQALSSELSSFGLRVVDAEIDEDLCIPGYEYHYYEYADDKDSLHSQIPKGYAGKASEIDPDRADASPWIEKLPVMKKFRKAMSTGSLRQMRSNEFTLLNALKDSAL